MNSAMNLNANFETLRLKTNEIVTNLRNQFPDIDISPLLNLPYLDCDGASLIYEAEEKDYDDVEVCKEVIVHLLKRTDTLQFNQNVMMLNISALISKIQESPFICFEPYSDCDCLNGFLI